MSKSGGIEEDLRYVRSVLDVAGSSGQPAVIYYLWAALSFLGLSLIDFKPEIVGPFWAIAGPLGGVASAYLGRRVARASGQESRLQGKRQLHHWFGMMAAILLVIPLQARGLIHVETVPSIILLILAFSYYMAGNYLDRRLTYLGLLTAACYLATVLVRGWPYVWTFTGSVLAAGLVTTGVLVQAPWRRRAGGGPS